MTVRDEILKEFREKNTYVVDGQRWIEEQGAEEIEQFLSEALKKQKEEIIKARDKALIERIKELPQYHMFTETDTAWCVPIDDIIALLEEGQK